ncbi:MAG: SgcJ/EcaC family oxidoreductase [Nocardiopsaceae bacterium]|jgi:uncharacterized protein (TIGR02246 family)|nr:SgcJ/EcaC family oxidoreductase [Nocardiopsaceae bacterium]
MGSTAKNAQDIPELLRQAWDAGDAEAYGNLFTEEAPYVVFRGDVLLGRDQIREAHHGLFTTSAKGTKLIAKVLQSTMIDEGTCVLLTIGGIGRGELVYDKFQTLTLIRRDGHWLVAAFQNTEMSARSQEQYNN